MKIGNIGPKKMKKKYSFLKETLKGTKECIILILILTIVGSRLNVYVPMFIQYALDGVVLGAEEVIPEWIRRLFYSDSRNFENSNFGRNSYIYQYFDFYFSIWEK